MSFDFNAVETRLATLKFLTTCKEPNSLIALRTKMINLGIENLSELDAGRAITLLEDRYPLEEIARLWKMSHNRVIKLRYLYTETLGKRDHDS